MEVSTPLMAIFSNEQITEEEILEWKKLHVDTSALYTKWWDKIEKNKNKSSNIFRTISFWIKFVLKWFFPLFVSVIGGIFLPYISMKSLNCIIYPIQLLLFVYMGIIGLNYFIVVAGRIKFDEIIGSA